MTIRKVRAAARVRTLERQARSRSAHLDLEQGDAESADAKSKEQQRFASGLAQHLERQAPAGAFGSVEVYAASPFLGTLKAALGDASNRLLSGTLTGVPAIELQRRLARETAP